MYSFPKIVIICRFLNSEVIDAKLYQNCLYLECCNLSAWLRAYKQKYRYFSKDIC